MVDTDPLQDQNHTARAVDPLLDQYQNQKGASGYCVCTETKIIFHVESERSMKTSGSDSDVRTNRRFSITE